MSAAVRLPPELSERLNLAGPQSMLIRGPPGSGKTTLSLALLEAFHGKKIMVTSRVPDQELGREFPWLGENGGKEIRVIDTTPGDRDLAATLRAQEGLSRLVRETEGKSDDLRSFLWLPPALQEAWAHLEVDEPTMVVVDSWDALVEGFLGGMKGSSLEVPDRPEVERLLLRQMGKAPVHMVLVLEREEQTQLDYLVHGVAQTSIEFHDERMERWLRLRKLRGVRIENALYPFSLEGAKFECIEPIRAYRSLSMGRPEAEPDMVPGHLWPGCRSFADSFGRLPLGHLTLVEMDETVPGAVADILATPVIASVLEKGGPVVVLPEARPTPAELWTALRSSVSRQKFLNFLRFLQIASPQSRREAPGSSEFARTVMTLDPPKEGAPPAPPEESPPLKFLRSGGTPGAPGLLVLHVAGLYSIASSLHIPITPEVVGSLPASFRETITGQSLHGMVFGRSGNPMFESLRPVAALHLGIRTRQGRILVHGIVPWTTSFLLVEGRDPSPYNLLRIV